jgi:hypothetical protein
MSTFKRKLVGLSTVAAVALGMLVFPVAAVESASAATTHNRVCTRVTVPKTLPWYRCVNLGTMPAGSLPSGCFNTTKVVCK